MGPGMCPGISKTCWSQPLPFWGWAEQGAAPNTPSSTAQPVPFFLQKPLLRDFCSPFLVSLAQLRAVGSLASCCFPQGWAWSYSRGWQVASPIPHLPLLIPAACQGSERKPQTQTEQMPWSKSSWGAGERDPLLHSCQKSWLRLTWRSQNFPHQWTGKP